MSTIAVERGPGNLSSRDASNLRLLALVPPCEQGRQISRYSFLVEELEGLISRGVEVHLASRRIKSDCRINGAFGHPIPRLRDARGIARAVRTFSSPKRCMWLQGAGFREKMTIVQNHAAIAKIILEKSIDIIYSPFLWPNSLAGLPVAQSLDVPVVASLRGADTFALPEIGYGQSCSQRLQRTTRVLQAADHIVGISSCLIDRAVTLGAPPERTSVIHKGVDLRRFIPFEKNASRRQLNLVDAPTLLYVGNLVPCKGVSLLLPALKKIHEWVPETRLLICGDGPMLGALKAEFENGGIGEAVRFLGRVGRREIVAYFNASDVLVLPSLSEGAGNVLIEAGACGKPVIAANVGGIPDYVDDGVTGFLFARGDSADFAAKAIRLLSDPKMAQQFGLAGRERVERQYTFDGMIDQLLSLFASVIARRGRNKGFRL